MILTAPTLTPGDKSQIIQELQKHMGGGDKGDTVKNFLNTLAENNRLGILEGVCEKFSMLMGAHHGEVDLTITSATVCTPLPSDIVAGRARSDNFANSKKLDSKFIQRLETAVAKSEYSQGKKLKVVPKVGFPKSPPAPSWLTSALQINPDIMGGLIVEIGDRTIDRAVSSKISRLNKALTDAL